MVAVGLDVNNLEQAIAKLNLTTTCVSCLNSPNCQTISGCVAEIEKLQAYLIDKYDNLFWKNIPTDNIAYHSPYLYIFYKYLHDEIKKFITIESNLPNEWLSTNQCTKYDSHYHIKNIVNPVYFTEACKITKSCGFIVEKHLMNGEGHTISSKTLKLVQYFLKKYM